MGCFLSKETRKKKKNFKDAGDKISRNHMKDCGFTNSFFFLIKVQLLTQRKEKENHIENLLGFNALNNFNDTSVFL